MTSTASRTERRLLMRIMLQFIVWYAIAFILFETVLVGGTYAVLRNQLMNMAYRTVLAEWSQKLPDALVTLQNSGDTSKSQPTMETHPEVVATWVLDAKRHVVEKDTSLISASSGIDQLFLTRINNYKPADSGPFWSVDQVNKTPILIGIKPLYNGDHYLGSIISAYSLRDSQDTLKVLVGIDVDIGLISVGIILFLTYFLARRSLRPIRLSLHRQREFVNDAAHELRTPLTIVRATLDLARCDDDPAALRQAIGESLGEVDYIKGLLDNLSILARAESGATQLNFTTVDVAKVAREALESAATFARPKQIEMACENCQEPVMLVGDALRLRQLLLILLENAVKYNCLVGHVKIQLIRTRSDVEIAVTDTGIGIDPDDLPHVFDRFYRSRHAEQFASGSGIGLSVAAWLADAHGGRMEVTSEVNRGSTFKVVLPVKLRDRLKFSRNKFEGVDT